MSSDHESLNLAVLNTEAALQDSEELTVHAEVSLGGHYLLCFGPRGREKGRKKFRLYTVNTETEERRYLIESPTKLRLAASKKLEELHEALLDAADARRKEMQEATAAYWAFTNSFEEEDDDQG